jgi:hypothetical protein
MKKNLKITLLAVVIIISTIAVASAVVDHAYLTLEKQSTTKCQFSLIPTHIVDTIEPLGDWVATNGEEGNVYVKSWYEKDGRYYVTLSPHSLPKLPNDVSYKLTLYGTLTNGDTFSVSGTGFAWGRGK